MYTLLLVVLLLALLFDTAAATSPIMDPNLTAPIEDFLPYSDPAGILSVLCPLCDSDICLCLPTTRPVIPTHLPNFTDTFREAHAWPQEAAYDEPYAEPQLPALLPPPPFFEPVGSPPLVDANVRRLDDNGTTIQPSTIQVHVEGTYNPGDRLQAASLSPSRRSPNRRQQPKPGGFKCPVEGCGSKPFNRSCDLKRHQKTHLGHCERPHKCSFCGKGFLYPKDCARHERTHNECQSASTTLYCLVPNCANVEGFSRRDNLLRHQRTQHPIPVSA